MVRVLVTLILPGEFFLLILSYLAAKVTPCGTTVFAPLSTTANIFDIGLAISPRNGAEADARSFYWKGPASLLSI